VPDSTTSPRQTATIIEEHFGRKALYVNFRQEQAIVKRPEYAPKTKQAKRPRLVRIRMIAELDEK
jgi:hypothetical protein